MSKPVEFSKHGWLFSLTWIALLSGCQVLSPKKIDCSRMNIAPALIEATQHSERGQIERGKPRPVIDAVGWVVGIPPKLVLWNRKVENHRIGPETEGAIREYLDQNGLDHVKVRLNQYRPWDDMRRLTKNQTMAWPWRYSVGVLSVAGEAILPGRLFGGDHFNPYTHTVHLYSDVEAIGLHEAAHAKDFSRREYPGTYAALYGLPVVPLYHESIASRDVMAYLETLGKPQLQRQAYQVLYPAYGTYVGGAVGTLFPVASLPAYYGSVALGHMAGRYSAQNIPDSP